MFYIYEVGNRIDYNSRVAGPLLLTIRSPDAIDYFRFPF
jgi:hypothetical protein